MRICGPRVDRALQQRAYPVNRAADRPVTERARLQATPAYRVTLSPTAREVAAARRSASEPPAARAGRVAAVKQAIDQGTYHPASRAFAQKIMEFIGLASP